MARAARKMETEISTPTPEQMRAGVFELEDTVDKLPNGRQITIGKAYRRRPMIDILHDQGLFSEAEHKALRHYRHHADLVDRSPLKDSIRKLLSRGGDGDSDGPTRIYLNAAETVNACEKAVGILIDILRAVVVYDVSLSQWVIDRHGAVELNYSRIDRNGRKVKVKEFRADKKRLKHAKADIITAARRIQAELDATY